MQYNIHESVLNVLIAASAGVALVGLGKIKEAQAKTSKVPNLPPPFGALSPRFSCNVLIFPSFLLCFLFYINHHD